MSRPAKMEGMAWINPYLIVKDVEKAANFYSKAFGFEFMGEPMKDDNGVMQHTEMKHEEGVIMLGAEGAFGGTSRAPVTSGTESPVSIYVYCQDVDKLFEKAKAAGATVICEPQDQFWGDRMCGFTDPDGHRWSFATNVADHQ